MHLTRDERKAAQRALHTKHTEPLDLYPCPPKARSSVVDMSELVTSAASFPSDSIEVLCRGTILLRNYLPPAIQQYLIDACRELGIGVGGFYQPIYASGAKCKVRMMCLGKHWDITTEAYEQTRTNGDGAPVPDIPSRFNEIVQHALALAKDLHPAIYGSCTRMTPDICVVNYYNKAGRNGLHIDQAESKQALDKGSPVVSFSLGDEADFAYAMEFPTTRDTTVPSVRLRSGDVLIFGGPSRRLVHALTRIYPNTKPKDLHMCSGRVNLTFRSDEPEFH